MNRLISFLSHCSLILAIMLITLTVVDRFNPSMDFINNDISKLFILLLCICVVILALLVLIEQRHRNR